MTDAELIEGCRMGDRTKQRLLFERFSGTMMALCLRYCKDRMEAEDMLQIGFVKALTHMDQHRGGSLEGWLKRIFVHSCLSQWRKNKASLIIHDESKMNGILEDEDGLQRLQAAEILELISNLPAGARLIFNLFAIEGYPHTEIATMLDITEGASRAQLTRARQLLQQKLRNYT